MINTSISGTAFIAVSIDVINRSTKEMSEEKIFSSDVSESSNDLKTQKEKETSNITYETQHKLSNSSLVAFNDPTNGKYAIVSLQNSTIGMLKNHFGESDFYKRDDGITRLDNKAEAYVAGWFGDIAYKREFLSADSNKDGILSDGEYGNTKNSFSHHGTVFGFGDNIEINTWVGDTYQNSSVSSKNFINHMTDRIDITIDKQLDITINNDDDFNSKISFEEALTAHYNTNTKNSIIQLAKDMVGLPKELEDVMMMEKLKKLSEHNDDKIRAMVKLLLEKGDISMLDISDKELLVNELSEAKEDGSDIQKIMNDKLDELLKIQKYKEYE